MLGRLLASLLASGLLELHAAAPEVNATSAFITIGGVSDGARRIELTGPGEYVFSLSGEAGATWQVSNNHSSAIEARIDSQGVLHLTASKAGRAGLRLGSLSGNSSRHIGVVVKDAQGNFPGWPDHLAVGSVSDDSAVDLGFWWDFQDGRRNRFVDVRYEYLNGGPSNDGWISWGATPGSRAQNFIRESQRLGSIPFFVYYNIPDSNESYAIDFAHMQDTNYVSAYFGNLKFLLRIIAEESPNEPVGIVLEPDFIGYMAQNSGQRPDQLTAATRAAYAPGLLVHGTDPEFPDTLTGLVHAINYLIAREAPHAWFGWQMNLWASPTGGFTTPVPGNGLMHKTDADGIVNGRALIYGEAAAITRYYLDAGIASAGAGFVSVDKYGFDATGANPAGVANPAAAPWFWNSDHWGNYLTFARAMHETAELPVVLWQLPVGHINHSVAVNPYVTDGIFPDLDNSFAHYEDSAPDFFFGDAFTTSGLRLGFFAHNESGVPGLTVAGNRIDWPSRMTDARDAGIVLALFGAGVGASTHNIGVPPGDQYWWITKAQDYLAAPVPLLPVADKLFANGFDS